MLTPEQRPQEQASSAQTSKTLRRGMDLFYRLTTNLVIGSFGAAGSYELLNGHTVEGGVLLGTSLLITATDTARTAIVSRRQHRLVEQQQQEINTLQPHRGTETADRSND